MLDSLLLLIARLEPIYESESDSPPPTKHSHKNEIMTPPANHWNEEDYIYGLDTREKDEGFPQICSSVSFSSYTLHDSLMAALVPTASSYINMCGSVCPCNKDHSTCMKCAHRHETFKNHCTLGSSALMHFPPLRDAFMTYYK